MSWKRSAHMGLLLAAALGLAGCNGSSQTTAPTTLHIPTNPVPGHPTLTLTPPEPYPHNAIQITAIGFHPHESLQIVECGYQSTSVNSGYCDTRKIKPVTASMSGKVQATFIPTEGPFGARHVTCQRSRSCQITLSRPSGHPTALAAAPLTFR